MTGIELPAGWPGYLVGIIGVLFPFVLGWRRGKIDESAMILGRWKDMVDQHSTDIRELREELRMERADNVKLRQIVSDQQDEIATLKEEIAGLKRQIATYTGQGGYLEEMAAKIGNPRTPRRKGNGGKDAPDG